MEISDGIIGQSLTLGDEQPFSRREAAQYLGVALVTVDRLIKSGKVGFGRIGRRLVFRKKHLDAFLKANEIQARVPEEVISVEVTG